MRLRTRRFLLLAITFIVVGLSVGEAFAQIVATGYMRHFLVSSPYYFNPGYDDWLWEIWNGKVAQGGGSNISPATSLPALAGARLRLIFSVGNQRSPFYLYMPMLFYTNAYFDQGKARLLISNGDELSDDNFFAMQMKGKHSSVSLTSQWLNYQRPWVFSDLGDPLGALKLPNTSAPSLTFKVTSNLPWGWEGIGYYLADTRCNFIPVVEKIPAAAYGALNTTPQMMLYYDEIPSYVMGRATKQISNMVLGFILGEKQVVNLHPRNEDEQIWSPPKPTHGVGYKKLNYGFDLSGPLRFGNDSKFTIATVFSQGKWEQYKKGIDNTTTSTDLGRIGGKAYKVELHKIQLGNACFSGGFNYVTPDFQLVAARNSRYAYTIQYNSHSRPTSSYTSWRPILDEEFLIRDSNQKDKYLSDVASFLGLRAYQMEIDVPGKVRFYLNSLPSNFKLKANSIQNERSGSFFDPFTWQEQEKGYRELTSLFELRNGKNKFNVIVSDRLYEQDFSLKNRQNVRQKLGLEFGSDPQQNVNYVSQISKVWRLIENDGLDSGECQKFLFQLKSITDSGMKSETSLNHYIGDYTDDIRGVGDHVLPNEFSYLSLSQYFELINNFKFRSNTVRTKFAGEVVYKSSNLPNISGICQIGFVEGKTNITKNLELNALYLRVKGPETEGFASNHLSNIADYNLVYRPFGSKENRINFRMTRRYLNEGLKTNWYIRSVTQKGKHSLTLTYGDRPMNEYITIAAGTPINSRYLMPAMETMNKPWDIWREQTIYSDETNTNYFSLVWSFRF